MDPPTGLTTEDPDYLSGQLITYIGNKRALLRQIGGAVEVVKKRLGKRRLDCFDAFSGSGVVSRFLKGHACRIVSNDIEDYARIISTCYLANRSETDRAELARIVAELNAVVDHAPLSRGFIEELYAPRDETNITAADRVFYTIRNARRLDNYRRLIDQQDTQLLPFLLAPLLSEASIHANTAGVFKGFYKNRHTKVGQFGGSGADALQRIRGDIKLVVPVLSRFECDYAVLQDDATVAVRKLRDFDLAYFDPPYNQHPYGSNYFMLNLVAQYQRPTEISKVSGIPNNWRRSGYNKKSQSAVLFRELLEGCDAKFLLISFNDEGFISTVEMNELLNRFGTVTQFEHAYNTFRGSRNLRQRSLHVKESLFLVERY